MKKNCFVVSALLFVVLSVLVGCTNLLKSEDEEPKVEYGSIVVSQGGDARALEISSIKFAKVEVSGTGIGTIVPDEKPSVTNGQGSITINSIPVGKNRVVTVYEFDSSKTVLQGVTIRNIVDVEAGKENKVSVNWSTTALGNVFNELHSLGENLADVDKSKIKDAIDSTKHASLINAKAIASDYKAGTLKNKATYVSKTAKAVVNFNQNDGPFKVQVCDPLSAVKTGISGVTEIDSIAPGTWKILLLKDDGTIIKQKTLNVFKAGESLPVDMNEKVWTDIVVHAKKTEGHAKYVWWWPTGGTGKCAEMTEESGGWYGYTFRNTSEINVIFGTTKLGDDWSGKLNEDLLISKPGEYWFKDGKLYDGDPNDSQVPELTLFTADKTGTVSGDVVFTISATDNTGLAKAELSIGSEVLASVNLSGKTATENYVWNSASYKNGSYEISCVVYDGAGNKSDAKTLSFTTNNANLPPVAVISGSSRATSGSDKSFSGSGSYDQTKGGTIKSYSWSVTGGATIKSGANADTCTVTMPSGEGTVKLTLTVTDEEGATGSVTKEVTVKTASSSQSNDFREETIYFLMTTRFYDGDPSNNEYCWDEGGEYLPLAKADTRDCAWRGDFKGLIEKLDYIKALGFSAIWITPVVENASGIDYHGYHASNFKKVDERYESSGADYQALIDACHAKGIKVIQDIVLNHTGNFGETGLFHMFDKGAPIVKPGDTAGMKRSKFMEVAANGGYGYECLEKGAMMAGGLPYAQLDPNKFQYPARINAMKEDSIDTKLIYHHAKMIDWNSINCQLGQMAGDCVDLNTENPEVIQYLIEAYSQYIDMGVDAFRIDTVKHINRLIFNKYFNPAFMEAARKNGNDNFYMFGEVCARYRGRWNEGVPSLSPSFYTWKETDAPFTGESPYSYGTEAQNTADTAANFAKYASGFNPPISKSESNTFLKGNDYHKPDYTNKSDLCVIDFPMHWAFRETGDAFRTALDYDADYSDATWNVVYVDSHDYAPDNAPENKRFNGYWPDKLNLMWTFRGIPCIYYGSEIEFQKGKAIDAANERVPLEESGRAYFGDHLEGTVTASDYGVYTASGKVAETLNHELAQQIIALNKIRRAVPALQKGQYSREGCSGEISFKRRYTDDEVDSFAVVAINGQATFSGIPSGTYTEMVTGKTVSCSGSLTSDSIGQGNMRVYVLNYTGESGFKGGTLQ